MNSVTKPYLSCRINSKNTDRIKLSTFVNHDLNPRNSQEIPNNTDVLCADEFTQDLAKLANSLKENLRQAIKKQRKFVDKNKINPPDFKPSNKVWTNNTLIIRNDNKKSKSRKLGPYGIIKKVSSASYKPDLLEKILDKRKLYRKIQNLINEKDNLYQKHLGSLKIT